MKREKRCAGSEMFFCFVAIGFLYVLICQSGSKKQRKGAVLSLLLPVVVSSVLLVSRAPQFSVDPYQSSPRVGRSLLMHWDSRIINLEDKMYLAGYIIGVFSAGLYVCSRVPQIVKNVRNLSLSPPLSLSLSLSLSAPSLPHSSLFLPPTPHCHPSFPPTLLFMRTSTYIHTHILTVYALFSGRSIRTHVHSRHPW